MTNAEAITIIKQIATQVPCDYESRKQAFAAVDHVIDALAALPPAIRPAKD